MSDINILVVDDWKKPREYIVKKLKSNSSWNVYSASNEAEAIEKLKNNKYDIVVSDMVMENPDSGLKILDAAQKIDKTIEVIVVTAYASVPNAVEAMRLGAFNYIDKEHKSPYKTIYENVKKAIDKKINHNFDIFLSYNREDVERVKDIAVYLKKHNIYPWFDKWEILGGCKFQDKMEQAIKTINAVAIFIGEHGQSTWQKDEIDLCQIESKKRDIVLIPVLLENAKLDDLPFFLKTRNVVDFNDPLDRLIKSIKPSK